MELTIKNLNVKIAKKEIIKNLSLHTKKKEFVGIIGANGSGKSTLLKTVYKSITPQQGSIFLNDFNLIKSSEKEASCHLGVVSQFNELNFDLTVFQMVLLGRTPHKKLLEADTQADFDIVHDSLAKTNLLPYKDRSFLSLSGGEKQRVILARTIAQKPDYMILDEPTNHLDIRYQLEILECVKQLNISVLAALHDIEMAANYCDYLYAMKNGEIIAAGKPNEILTEELIEEIFDVKCSMFKNPLTDQLGFVYHLK